MEWSDSRDSRVEVIRNGHTLLLKRQDVTISQLARILKIKPHTLYLEEEVTNNVELADTDGRFHPSARSFGVRYKVCGEDETTSNESTSSNESVPTNVWSTPRPWQVPRGRPSTSSESSLPITTKRNVHQQPSSFESNFKKCIPFVTLALDGSGKMVVESTDDNVYIKIPESSVSTQSILSAIGPKIAMSGDDLIVLDSKFIPVSDDKDMEYWKTPSRRLYVARHREFEELLVKQREGKRLNLSLSRKRKHKGLPEEYSTELEDLQEYLAKIETSVETVSDAVTNLSKKLSQHRLHTIIRQHFECKICLALSEQPIVVTTCCNQLLGCDSCYKIATEEDIRCPLCRGDVSIIHLRGFDSIVKELKKSDDDDREAE